VRPSKLIALVTGVALAVAAIVTFAATAAARRGSAHPHRTSAATTSHTATGGHAASGSQGNVHSPGLTAVSAGIGLRPGAVSPSEAGIATAQAAISSLTPLQLAGQRVIYSFTGMTPPARLFKLIKYGEVAGVIFFTNNVGKTAADLANFKSVVRQLERANASQPNKALSRLPLLLMTDQEGGLVRRLPGPPSQSEKQIGAISPLSAAKAAATSAGSGAAANLRSFGLNVNLGPVLDVYRTPGNFIDEFGRSFSSNPKVVAALGAAFATAEQRGGLGATVKHFPGLGAAATRQNTDERPVTLNLPLAAIRGIDEFPYQSAVAAKVKLAMVSWALYPALDRTYPAGLSSTTVQGELRHRLGFAGVTITDALEAGALKDFGSIASRSTLAARAGMDLLLCAEGDYIEGYDATHTLASDYTSHALNASAFKAAAERVMALRATLPG
jgi:beta-N-acetylhexosaminidase